VIPPVGFEALSGPRTRAARKSGRSCPVLLTRVTVPATADPPWFSTEPPSPEMETPTRPVLHGWADGVAAVAAGAVPRTASPPRAAIAAVAAVRRSCIESLPLRRLTPDQV